MERAPMPPEMAEQDTERTRIRIVLHRTLDWFHRPDLELAPHRASRYLVPLSTCDDDSISRLQSRFGSGDYPGMQDELGLADQYRVYWNLRHLGLEHEQVVILARAARQDAREGYGADSYRHEALYQLYRQECRDIDALIAHGTVTSQLRHVTESVIGYVREHGFTDALRSQLAVDLIGPVGSFIQGADGPDDAPVQSIAYGCFSPFDETVVIRLSETTLRQGQLCPTDIHTAVHEAVHASSPNEVTFGVSDDGKPRTTKYRTGFSSRATASTRRTNAYSLVGLNEGVTELLARYVGSHRRLGGDYSDSSYEGYVTDISALCREADISLEYLFALYYDPRGILKLNRLLVQNSSLGPDALTLFEISNRSGTAGFSRFVRAKRLWDINGHIEPDDMVVIRRDDLINTAADGAMRPRYPGLPPDRLEREYPFVRVEA